MKVGRHLDGRWNTFEMKAEKYGKSKMKNIGNEKWKT